MDTKNFVECTCQGQEYVDCECNKDHCTNCTCKGEVTLAEFEAQFEPELGYLFGPTYQYSGSKPKTIELKVPRKNPQ